MDLSLYVNSLITFYIFVALFIISIYMLVSKSLLTITLLSSIFSICCAILYTIMGAPDVALTESAVGAGLTTTLSLLTIFITKTNKKFSNNINKTSIVYNTFIIILVSFSFIVFIIGLNPLPSFGSLDNPAINETYLAYTSSSYSTYKVKNIVTMILGSFRGFDTLGEVLVIFTAAIAVIALIRQGKTNV